MSRDKQIEEMAKLLCSTCYETNEEDCKKFEGVCGICDANRLYNAGYRKSTDIAEEIFAEIDTLLQLGRRYNMMQGDYYTFELRQSIAELKKKYTEREKDNEKY